MKHRYIEVVILLKGSSMRLVGEIPATHKQAFEECLKQGLNITFPIYRTRIIITPESGGKTILVPK